MKLITFLAQQPDIEKKMEEAPDSAYEIGVVIGSYLPFVVLLGIAYAIYYYNKRKRGS
ncbi:hypothetical protein [Flagellimonas hymeniacidonis]|uniref:hypothetical protein n=1 Tax=Flagellimonas hymeniacidonis TaxID=2603628 RepID=UPI00164F5C86|nr:hypothetical protein [Flagellimonas hymeniacidonis]